MREGYHFLCGASEDVQGILCFRRAAGEARLEGLDPQKDFILCLCLNGQARVLCRLKGRGGALPFSADPAWADGNMVLLGGGDFRPLLWERPLSPFDREALWRIRKKAERQGASDAACPAAEKQGARTPAKKNAPVIQADRVPADAAENKTQPEEPPPHAAKLETAREAVPAAEPVFTKNEDAHNTSEEVQADAAALMDPAWYEYTRRKPDGAAVFPVLPALSWSKRLAAYHPYFEHGAPEPSASASSWRFVRVAANGKQGIDNCLLGRHTAGDAVDAVAFLIDETQVHSPQTLQGYSRQRTADGKGYYVLTLRAD